MKSFEFANFRWAPAGTIKTPIGMTESESTGQRTARNGATLTVSKASVVRGAMPARRILASLAMAMVMVSACQEAVPLAPGDGKTISSSTSFFIAKTSFTISKSGLGTYVEVSREVIENLMPQPELVLESGLILSNLNHSLEPTRISWTGDNRMTSTANGWKSITKAEISISEPAQASFNSVTLKMTNISILQQELNKRDLDVWVIRNGSPSRYTLVEHKETLRVNSINEKERIMSTNDVSGKVTLFVVVIIVGIVWLVIGMSSNSRYE